ncbi:hypothetical protein GCM10025864_13710 [Luteimicrobium album]|uniref:Type II toxin-antitoxin system RelE/ParE family toxin n=1 Tax=Luteimicrobium album TaxID=1054550 RepID=A0ABQ6I045_9MICO|nr:type II toxin-antitoxin system RelE/ParE family toxin [Luteimicrobium album]GMA23612.1 hypothetical protein GCM10025864_13710 [Luteimicrobium album]
MTGSYTVEFTTGAAREIKKLPLKVQVAVLDAAGALESDPRPHGCKQLSGHDAYRIRVAGDYRVIGEVDDRRVLVTVLTVGNRPDVYRKHGRT